MMYVISGLVIWSIISFRFFRSTLGCKHRKGKWYDWPLLGPTYVIFVIAFWICTKAGFNK
jgi:hypothetical protein